VKSCIIQGGIATKGTEGTEKSSTGGWMRARDEKAILELCNQIRQIAFELQAYLRHGHLEKVYENGLAHRLREAGMKVEQQKPISVYDEDGTILGEYFTDLFVEDCLIVELNACRLLADEHAAQVLDILEPPIVATQC
jgi:GxxExxY protein